MEFTIRPYKNGDEHKILEMFNEVFSENRKLEHWYWKYRDNPYGAYFITLATAEDGTIAAHYAGYPVKLCFYGSLNNPPDESMTYHIGDKMTREKFRSIGFGKSALLTKTFLFFKDFFAKKHNVPFAYGFTTHHSKRFGLLLLNYADIEPVPYRVFDIDKLNGLSKYSVKEILTGIRVSEVNEIDERWTDFFLKVAPYYKYLIRRDATYLKWRYIDRPDRDYLILAVTKRRQLTGWSVFYREADKIIWGDALFRPGDPASVKTVLGYLRKHSLTKGVKFIECWFPPRPQWWDTILKGLGFKTEVEPSHLHLTPPVFIKNGAIEKLRNYFYYTMGDSDLF